MRLFEFEAKDILRKYRLPIPQGDIASSADEAAQIAKKLGGAVALKSQILTSSRGKAGGIIFASDANEAKEKAENLLKSTIKGNRVDKILVEEKLPITQEFYTSVTIDRSLKTYIILASTQGGVDIEEVAQSNPEKIIRKPVDPLSGFDYKDALEMLQGLGLRGNLASKLAHILSTLYKIALDYDAELVETNPLAETPQGELIAADARIIIDDNAIFRHPEFKDKDLVRLDDTPLEAEARREGFAYVDLDGDIGIIGNGAGLMMATLDLVNLFGGRPANFLDIGGGARPEVVERALSLVMSKPQVKAILVNILGGITRCDLVAQGVISALSKASNKKPIVVRMMGTNEEEGARMLKEAGIESYPSLEEAIKKVLTF